MYYGLRIRHLDGSVKYIRTRRPGSIEGDVIRYITTASDITESHIGIVEGEYNNLKKTQFAMTTPSVANIAGGVFKELNGGPYLICRIPIREYVFNFFYDGFKPDAESPKASIEVGFGFDIETPDMIRGYRLFSDGEVGCFLYNANRVIAFVKNGNIDGIEEIHFRIDKEINAVEIVTSADCGALTDTVFAALTVALTVDLEEGPFIAISSKLLDTLEYGPGEETDDEDDFIAIDEIFSRRTDSR